MPPFRAHFFSPHLAFALEEFIWKNHEFVWKHESYMEKYGKVKNLYRSVKDLLRNICIYIIWKNNEFD